MRMKKDESGVGEAELFTHQKGICGRNRRGEASGDARKAHCTDDGESEDG